MRAPLALLALAAALLTGSITQDPSSYPDGVSAVSNTPIRSGQDFEVRVRLDGPADTVAVTVCRFKSEAAPTADVCYMNLGAKAAGGEWTATTSAVEHPPWRDGWVIGYKVTVERGGAELHAPDRVTSTGDPDYYRAVVGREPAEPAPTGSAVVEDDVATPEQASASDAPQVKTQDSPAPGLLVSLAVLALAALARR